MVKNHSEETVVVKGSIPRALKLEFKVLCVQKELEMSEVLENLIRHWIQTDSPVGEFSSMDLLNQEFEDVKAYVPKSLKRQFKLLCTQKRVTIRSILYVLIKQWVQMGEVYQFCTNSGRKNNL
ncbi:hypothetical protein I8748_10285 [Nostoc sp. CENA67]|uniref:Uncharacterized protein n=1 Tax=Amazonocrinis nigriterrae CENA67 TaxID=2794033 RepID=A0A8J7HR78_9NOST|nr:hypothetical protein [Amazonocrinis nigriterrae]MBH8562560.1 hypothetical protein [Amazonocrinis nigriterrae CENA67]